MKRILTIACLMTLTGAAWAVKGDLDRDGDVDFDDFFIFADNFGKTGAPNLSDCYFEGGIYRNP